MRFMEPICVQDCIITKWFQQINGIKLCRIAASMCSNIIQNGYYIDSLPFSIINIFFAERNEFFLPDGKRFKISNIVSFA